MNATTTNRDLEYYMGKLSPPYDSPQQAQIGRVLDEYGIPFFYRQPMLIYEHGRRAVWRPDFTLPTYNNTVIQYDVATQRTLGKGRRSVSDTYRLNGIPALFLEPSDLARPDWQPRLYHRLEAIYRQPLAYLRDGRC